MTVRCLESPSFVDHRLESSMIRERIILLCYAMLIHKSIINLALTRVSSAVSKTSRNMRKGGGTLESQHLRPSSESVHIPAATAGLVEGICMKT